MAELPDERQLVLERVPSWTGGRRVLGERRTLNCSTATISSPRRDATARCALDSELERQGGDGVWGPISTEFTRRGPRVRIPHSGWSASTIHRSPQIPSSAEGTTSTTRPKSGSTPRSGNTASTSRHSSKHNSTSSFIKTSGTPIRSLSVIERIYRSGLFGDRCHVPRGFVLIFFRVSTLNISGTL